MSKNAPSTGQELEAVRGLDAKTLKACNAPIPSDHLWAASQLIARTRSGNFAHDTIQKKHHNNQNTNEPSEYLALVIALSLHVLTFDYLWLRA